MFVVMQLVGLVIAVGLIQLFFPRPPEEP